MRALALCLLLLLTAGDSLAAPKQCVESKLPFVPGELSRRDQLIAEIERFKGKTGAAVERKRETLLLQIEKIDEKAVAKSKGRYSGLQMDSKYYGEQTWDQEFSRSMGFFGPVRYLTPEQRESCRVIVDAKGRLTYTNGTVVKAHDALFVLDTEGNLYINHFNSSYGRYEYKHSSILAGGPVATAGHIEVERGYVYSISNKSGHYKPDPATTQKVLDTLKEQGAPIDQVRVKDETKAFQGGIF